MKVHFLFIFLINNTYAKNSFYSRITPIPSDIQKLMTGKSWHEGCPVGFDRLVYLKLSYWGFDDKSHVGELIVYKDIAADTIATFKELYEIKFPIESMELPERFSEKSYASDNNTSAFYCRSDDQSPTHLSDHSYGIAIDVNSVYNPSVVSNHQIWPKEGEKYMDRSLQHKRMRSRDQELNKGWGQIPRERRRELIETAPKELSIRRCCELLELAHTRWLLAHIPTSTTTIIYFLLT
jgi:hypothetical protein